MSIGEADTRPHGWRRIGTRDVFGPLPEDARESALGPARESVSARIVRTHIRAENRASDGRVLIDPWRKGDRAIARSL